MKSYRSASVLAVAVISLGSWQVAAQESSSSATGDTVPHLVSLSGVLRDSSSHPVTKMAGVTFLIYKDQEGGAPLWLETQNVRPDSGGHYTVQLGASSAHGLPADIFTSGIGRWLAVQIGTEPEQPRSLLVAVPYAVKAADADTIGGLPPSAFVLAAPNASGGPVPATSVSNSGSTLPTLPPASVVTTNGGTVNGIPIYTSGTNIGNSILTQSSTTAINVGGKLNLLATGIATATAGKNSWPEAFVASAFNSGTATAVNQIFQWQAEPVGNNTAIANATFNLLFGQGTSAPTETGLKVSNKGILTFSPGQQFPGTGAGSVTSVALTAPTTDFKISGSPITTTGTLALSWKVPPSSSTSANSIVKRDATASFSANNINLAGTLTGTTSNATALSVTSSSSNSTVIDALASGAGTTFAVRGTSLGASNGSSGLLGIDNNTLLGQLPWHYSAGVTGGSLYHLGVLGYTNHLSDVATSYLLDPFEAGVFADSFGYIALAATSDTGEAIFADSRADSSPTIDARAQSYVAIIANSNEGSAIEANSQSGKGVVARSVLDWALEASTGSNNAVVATNNSPNAATIYGQNDTTSPTGLLFYVVSTNSAPTKPVCEITTSADLLCSGSVSAAARLPNGSHVALHAVQSPENWFEDFGSARLINGVASVTLDAAFAAIVNGSEYHVFLTPRGECEGLYVARSAGGSFEVRELRRGTSNIDFDYRIVARRLGYEANRMEEVHPEAGSQAELIGKQKAARSQMRPRRNERPLSIMPQRLGGKADPLPTRSER